MNEELPVGPLTVTLLMAAITYFWRSAGFWTMGLVPMTPRLRRGLEALPGAIVISTVLPMAARTGPVAAVSIAAAALVALATRNEFLAVLAGAGVAAAARLAL
jgi:uncharacterized membrane protein